MTDRRLPDRVWLLLATVVAVAVAAGLDAVTRFSTADWLLFMTAPAPWLFVARYAVVRWNATVSGRAIMLKSVGTSLFLALACVGVLFPPNWPGRDWVRFLVYAFLFAAQWYLATLLFRIQRLPGHTAREDMTTERTTRA